jgi:2-dehydro-3-deoxy-D-gluconate 5-dehydrogenase
MILDKFKLDGKVAIVTGSRRGLGRGMAVALAEAGADVAGLDRNNPMETCQKIEALGRRFRWLRVDLLTATPVELQQAVDDVVEAWGHVDILVNNAGICPRKAVLEFPEEFWNDTVQVNLNSLWFLSQIAARQMDRQGGGKIIQIASLLSHQGGAIVPAYTAAKHGVLGLTRAMSNELAVKHINVNSITPGYMHTDLTEPLVGNPEFNIEARIPYGRWGTPEDLQGAVVYLASSASDYVNGADLSVDGGWLAW